MPLPSNWTAVTLTGEYQLAGEALKGSITFTPTQRVVNAAAGVIQPPGGKRVSLDADGKFSLPLPVVDDPDVSPNGWAWRVLEELVLPTGQRYTHTYDIQVTSAMGSTVKLADLAPVTPVGEVSPYLRAVDLGTVVETPAGAQAKADAAQASAISQLDARVVSLAAASGVDDTAAINALLTAHAGKRIVGRPGAAYRISAPLVVRSGTTLDMTSCTVTLLPNSNCNLLNNAAVAATGTRDSNITVRGGTWVRPAPNGANNGWDHHSLRFRRVDGLRIENVRVETVVGKYAINLGDVTRYAVDGVDFAAFSDGVHIQGPAQHGYIGRVRGTTGDDMVAVTPRDWAAYDDVSGHVTDLTVEDISGVSTAACLFKVLGGSPATSARRIKVRGVSGTANNNAMIVGDDTAQANTTGGLVDEISVERVAVTVPNAQSAVYIVGSNIKRVRVSGVTWDNTSGTSAVVRVASTGGQVLENLTVDQIDVRGLGGPVVEVATAGSVNRLMIDRVTVASSVAGVGVLFALGSVTDLTLSRVSATLTGSSNVVVLPSSASAARIDRVTISDLHLIGTGGSVIDARLLTQTLPRVEMSNVTMSGAGWLADLGTATELHLSGITTASPGQGIINARATAVLTVKGSGLALAAGPQGLAVAAGGSVTARTFDLEVDASKLAKVANAMAYNTNAALGCGVGPIVCNGTLWKHLYTGLTY